MVVQRIPAQRVPAVALPGGLSERLRLIDGVTTAGFGAGPIDYSRYALETDDGFSLGLFRSHCWRDTGRRPVLLLHGVGANRYGFGLSAHSSLPRYLNEQGRDVWLLEFRGSRSSRDLYARRRPPIDFDHKLDYDLPAAITQILAATGAEAVDLVGHSMGGLLTYIYLGRNPGAPVGRAVTLSAPSTLCHMLPGPMRAGRRLLKRPSQSVRPLLDGLSGMGLDRLSKTRGPLGHLVMWRQHSRLGNMDRHERRLFLDHAVEDMTGSYAAQLMQWVVEGRLTSRSGEAYGDLLGNVKRPVRVIACSTDRVIPPHVVEAGYRALGGAEERDFVMVGKAHGSSRNYGHMDLLMARSAWNDVYAPIGDWLDRD